jgi:glycosyltransferase involved in cell wall biosynthesis
VSRIVTVSYTRLRDPGGVPRWNRDLHSAFPDRECVHYSWWDVCAATGVDPNLQLIPEWDKAHVLNQWLLQTKKITPDDVVLADCFWASGLEGHPRAVSVQHGNWSHTTHEDVLKGVPPEFPQHAAAQLAFRRRWAKLGKPMVAVSKFISEQMWLQWGFEVPYINNGIDTERFTTAEELFDRNRPVVIHFTTTQNKGLDHIKLLEQEVDADIHLLDVAQAHVDVNGFYHKLPREIRAAKYKLLAQADLVVHPSAHEGNSYAVLETLASGVPIVSYDVGLMFEAKEYLGGYWDGRIGRLMSRRTRSPETTRFGVESLLKSPALAGMREQARIFALQHDIRRFRLDWAKFVGETCSG